MPRPLRPLLPPEPPTPAVDTPPERWSPEPVRHEPVRAPTGRAWAAVLFGFAGLAVSAIAAVAPWATYIDGVELTGTQHGDGWIVLAIAAAGAALLGALAAGWRHLAARLGLAGTAVALFLVFLLNRIDISRSRDYVTGGPIDVGGGLYGVAAAACLVLAAALVIPARAAPVPA